MDFPLSDYGPYESLERDAYLSQYGYRYWFELSDAEKQERDPERFAEDQARNLQREG
jgi:hypothetical protein